MALAPEFAGTDFAFVRGFIAGFDKTGRAYDFVDFERSDLDPCVACGEGRGRHVVDVAEVSHAA